MEITNWIPCDERLPEYSKVVLAYSISGCDEYYLACRYSDGELCDINDEINARPSFTHWMPLPAPPKQING